MRLIDADELKKQFEDRTLEDFTCYHFTKAIDNAPTIEWTDIELMGYVNGEQITKIKPSKIEGHWEEGMQGYYCSICDEIDEDYWKHNYCPNCGAIMKEA